MKWIGLSFIGLSMVGCASDPEENSGPDAFLSTAESIKVGELANGELNVDDGDKTDWKSVDLAGGTFALTFTTDKASANVAVGVYNKHGELVGAGIRKNGNDDPLVIGFEVRSAGRHFVRLEHREGGKNIYGVQVDEGSASGPSKPVID